MWRRGCDGNRQSWTCPLLLSRAASRCHATPRTPQRTHHTAPLPCAHAAQAEFHKLLGQMLRAMSDAHKSRVEAFEAKAAQKAKGMRVTVGEPPLPQRLVLLVDGLDRAQVQSRCVASQRVRRCV